MIQGHLASEYEARNPRRKRPGGRRPAGGGDRANRKRCSEKIAPLIRLFAREVGTNEWTIGALQRFVCDREPTVVASSVDRILRMMRGDGDLDYRNIHRRRSLYRFTRLPENKP